MAQLCPHDDIAAACMECLEGTPPPPPPKPLAGAVLTARFDGVCAANTSHRIEAGDPIGLVPSLGGWCCRRDYRTP